MTIALRMRRMIALTDCLTLRHVSALFGFAVILCAWPPVDAGASIDPHLVALRELFQQSAYPRRLGRRGGHAACIAVTASRSAGSRERTGSVDILLVGCDPVPGDGLLRGF